MCIGCEPIPTQDVLTETPDLQVIEKIWQLLFALLNEPTMAMSFCPTEMLQRRRTLHSRPAKPRTRGSLLPPEASLRRDFPAPAPAGLLVLASYGYALAPHVQ